MTTLNVTSVADLEAVSPESFLVILGDHDLTVNTETDIARYLQPTYLGESQKYLSLLYAEVFWWKRW